MKKDLEKPTTIKLQRDDFASFVSTSPYYEIFKFVLKIDFAIPELRNENPESTEHFGKLLHEFIHYLQSHSTVFCGNAVVGLFSLQRDMLDDVMVTVRAGRIVTPSLFTKYRSKYDFLFRSFYFQLENRKGSALQNQEIGYQVRSVTRDETGKIPQVFIYENGIGEWIHVSPIVLRETMAMMFYFVYRGIGSDAILDFSKEFQLPSKYWIVFKYFLHTYPWVKDIRIFTLYFAELCLQFRIQNVFNVLKHLENELVDSSDGDPDSIFTRLVRNNTEFFHYSFREFDNALTELIVNFEKLGRISDYGKTVSKYLQITLAAHRDKKTGMSIFGGGRYDAPWVKAMISKFKSPVIIETRGPVMLIEDNEHQKDLSLLFGVSHIVDLFVKESKIHSCPFFSEIPICAVLNRKEEICLQRPFDIEPFAEGGCVFYNSLQILGMKKA